VFWVDVIIVINNLIVVSVTIFEGFRGDCFDIVTRPGIWAIEWAVTNNMTESPTVFISPSIFGINDALVNFTRVNNSIIVFITFSLEGRIMIRIDQIGSINLSISIGIIDFNNFFGDFMNIGTSPSTITSDWAVTINMTSFWTI
jgi:hypothetical protein